MELPQEIKRKKAVINVDNADNRCFAYAILSKVLRERGDRDPQRQTRCLRIWNEFDFSGLRYPTPFSDIRIFEEKNAASVNVYGLEYDVRGKVYVYPIRITKNFVSSKHFDLLYIQRDLSENEVNGHYCLITDLARLVVSQITTHRHGIFICRRCLSHFGSQNLLDSHEILCNSREPVNARMPDNDRSTCEFRNRQYKQEIPYIIYADLESALRPFFSPERDPNLNISYTDKIHTHDVSSYCYYIVSRNEADPTVYQPQLYRGPNAVRHFWENLRRDIERIGTIYKNTVPMSQEGVRELVERNDVICHICGSRPNNNSRRGMVIDHCHLTGRVRGWACVECNLEYCLPSFVSVVFHGGSNYDFKHIISEIYSEPYVEPPRVDGRRRRRNTREGRRVRPRNEFIFDKAEAEGDTDEDEEDEEGEEGRQHSSTSNSRSGSKVNVIAQNCENFISFEVPMGNNMTARFIDSYRFLQSSLSELAGNLTDDQMRHTARFFPGGLFPLARRKGVFPYEYIRSLESYNVTELPPIGDFYSSLTDETVTVEEYEHAKRVWEAFECSTLGDYSDVYLKIDVILLADIFENFRSLCLRVYQIDPAWVYSAPGLAWNAMLKLTGVKMELLTDYSMHLFVEAGIRGGYCCASKRYSVANNRDLPNFDDTREENHLFYIDANNLYGHSMSSSLPLNQFRWLEEDEINSLNVVAIPEEGDIGYILEVDLDYPVELHDEHNDLPFCPQQLKTTAGRNDPGKLIATLHEKKNYVVHYRYLQCALQNGLELVRIHRVLSFCQSKWLEPYIRMNNEWRTQATDDFSKAFFKLMNNSVFGKFLESVRKHRNFTIENSPHEIRRLIRKPNFKNRVILNEKTNLCLIEMGKTTIFFNKFIPAGAAILDLSKTLMYNFHYSVMKRIVFPRERIELAYMDTDSLTYDIAISSLAQRLMHHKRYFDFSNYPESHPLYDISNKGVLGKMKDEVKGATMREHCALRSKLYSFQVDTYECKKAKGVKKSVVRKTLSFADYVESLQTGRELYRKMCGIRSYRHQVHTIVQNKIAVSAYDDKRCVLEDGIHTLAWGHRDIPREEDLIYLLNHSTNEE